MKFFFWMPLWLHPKIRDEIWEGLILISESVSNQCLLNTVIKGFKISSASVLKKQSLRIGLSAGSYFMLGNGPREEEVGC